MRSTLLAAILVILGVAPGPAGAAAPAPDPGVVAPAPAPDALAQTATCTDLVGPGIPPPASVTLGQEGYHAAWYGQSGYPVLCPGSTTTATVAFMNAGSLGWYAGRMGGAAYLGTWGPEPGQDSASVLGGPDTGWPSVNRVAAQPDPYVGPGQVAWFRFTVRAPEAPGIYRLGLRPLIEGAQWMEDFGVFWYVTVKASDAEAPALPATTTARTYYPQVAADGSRSIRVPVLMYHYVGALPADADRFRVDLTVSPAAFEEQLRYLKASGYNAITTTDLWWSLDTGDPLPADPVMLTFDDGYLDHHANVLPLLQRYGMVGTFAVTANLVDRPGYLTRAMVRELADAGMDVQSHAVDHFSLSRLGYDQQVYQLCTARRILEEWTGKEVRHLIYPSGDHLGVSYAVLTGCGYLSGYRKDGGSMQSSNEMLTLRRTRIRGPWGLGAFVTALGQ